MKLICNRCQLILTSVLIGREEQIKDCYSQLEKHIYEHHKESLPEFQKVLTKLGLLITTYMLVHMYCLIPENETVFLGTHNKVVEEICKLLDIELEKGEEEKKPPSKLTSVIDLASNPL